jgi:hypothetical protein
MPSASAARMPTSGMPPARHGPASST